MKHTSNAKTYFALAFFTLVALLLAIVPALMVWQWHMMSAADPAVILGLAAGWVCALAILAGCAWYYRLTRAAAVQSEPVQRAADSPLPTV